MSNPQMASVLPDLHLLTVIAETRSLTHTARRLGVSKASVSSRLRQLERAVGMSLVRRTTPLHCIDTCCAAARGRHAGVVYAHRTKL